MTKKLRFMPYAQAQVRDYADIGRDLRILQSYATDVIRVDNGYMSCTGLYSMTTRKHISAFIREYFPGLSFQTVKALAGTGGCLNLLTGEIEKH